MNQAFPPGKATDVRVVAAQLYLMPIRTRMPLKFGAETLTSVTCARVRLTVADRQGRQAFGWGETPLSVQWAWPAALPYALRHDAMQAFCRRLTLAWSQFEAWGHPLEVGHDFLRDRLPELGPEVNLPRPPYLAALICNSAFDIALHDAFGELHGCDTYQTYDRRYLTRDLAHYLEPADSQVSFAGRYPADFLVSDPPCKLPAWHLVGGLDPLSSDDLTGDEPDDGYSVLLSDWIRTDGLTCLKVKLRGTDAAWDYDRLVRVGTIASQLQVRWLSADFNCTVTDPAYVNDILDRLRREHARLLEMIVYVEQPFPAELEPACIDVHETAGRKPLFLDESAHDWRQIRLGRSLGWSGVALKTCKTQTGALLSLCWSKAHGMPLMVQDLSNPRLAQIPHLRLAAHAGTIMGVETNGMQFYPAASLPEARVHPGMYQRRHGLVDLSTLGPTGFGYRVSEINRELPKLAAEHASE